MNDSPEMAEVRAAIEESLSASSQPQPPATDDAEVLDDAGAPTDAQNTDPEDADPEEIQGEAESEQEGVEKLVELAEQLGVEPAELYALKIGIDTGDGGDPQVLTIGELKDQYLGTVTERQQIAQQRAQLELQQADAQRAMQAQMQASGQQTQRMAAAAGRMQLIEQQWPELEQQWAELAKTDPGQASWQRQRAAESYESARAEHHSATNEVRQKAVQSRQAWEAQQHQALMQHVPDWADQGKRQTMQRDVAEFLATRYDIPASQLPNIDAATFRMVLDAMDGARLREQSNTAIEQIKRKGVVVPKGMRKSNATKAKAVDALTQRARQTGNNRDKLAAARAIFGTN